MNDHLKNTKLQEIIIMGGGLSGLCAAAELTQSIDDNLSLRAAATEQSTQEAPSSSQRPMRWRLFEKEPFAGGLAKSETVDGYTFDMTGHWLHLRNDDMRRKVMNWMSGEVIEVTRKSRSFSRGVLTGYPFQVFLHGHEPWLILDCLKGLWEIHGRRFKKPRNFDDFIYQNFGPGIAKHFLVPYNEKLWGVHPKEITSDWCKRFVPVPPAEQILAGAVGAELPEMGYNVKFLYPSKGGIGELPKNIFKKLPKERIHTSCPVEKVDHLKKRISVGGEWVNYSKLISTIPLPSLAENLIAPPKSIVEAARKLRATSVVYLDVAIKPAVNQSYHWVYLPDRGHPFYRVGVYSNAAPHMAPKNSSSLYVELAQRDISCGLDTILGRAIPALCAMGLINSGDDIAFAQLKIIPDAYVIYDHHYNRARNRLLRFFHQHGIYSCGRYGSWVYNSMEDSMVEGKRTAEQVVKDLENERK